VTAPLYLSVAETAAALGVSESHVRRHAPLVRVGRRLLVPAAWVHHPGQEVEDAATPVGERIRADAMDRLFEEEEEA
jgi:hypothetical protein